MLKVFIGYDSREIVAFHTLANSIMRQASKPVAIVPLIQRQLRVQGIYNRETAPNESTEFSLTRFLVPFLSEYKGFSVYMDCDMLVQVDIYELFDRCLINSNDAVSVVKHDYTPKTRTKMGGRVQTNYPRKNWSSFMVFNNAHHDCKGLQPYINTAEPSYLQQLKWTDKIGSLPLEWNWLVGEYEKNETAFVLHYTLGGPWFDPWFKELRATNG